MTPFSLSSAKISLVTEKPKDTHESKLSVLRSDFPVPLPPLEYVSAIQIGNLYQTTFKDNIERTSHTRIAACQPKLGDPLYTKEGDLLKGGIPN